MTFNPDNPEEYPLEDEGAEGGQPAQRRYGGGKYATLEEFEKGYSESFREVERLRMEAATQQAAQAAKIAALEVAIQQRQAPAAPEPDYLPISDEGLPREHVQRLAADAARQAVAEALKPLVQGANARTEMLRNAPEFAQHEVAVQQFLAANPQQLDTYNRIAAADPTAALRFAYSEYRMVNPEPSPAQKAEMDRQKVQAGLSGGSPSGRQRDEAGAMSPRVYDALVKEGRETGNWDKFLDYRLRGVIPSQFNER